MKILLLTLALSAAAFGQSSVTSPDVLSDTDVFLLAKLTLLETSIDACRYSGATPACKQYPLEMAALHSQLLRSPKALRVMVANAVVNHRNALNTGGEKSAVQISQIADQQNARLMPLLLLQNQRIIELLEAILKKPR